MSRSLIRPAALPLFVILLMAIGPAPQAQLQRFHNPGAVPDPVEPDWLPDLEHGRIPILEPLTITEPGSYFLARNLVANDIAIRIEADDVTLDLNGRTIERPPQGAYCEGGYFISVHGSRVTIRDGNLSQDPSYGFCSGIGAYGNHIRIERIHITGVVGISLAGLGGAAAESVEVLNNSYMPTIPDQWAFNISANHGRIIGNSIQSRHGMDLEVSNVEIRDNHLSDCLRWGIQIEGSGNVVRKNTTDCSGATNPYGIRILSGSGNMIAENTVRNVGIGSWGSGNRIAGNIIFNAYHGIEVRGANDYIHDNFIYGSTYGCIILFGNGSGHLYGRNVGADVGHPSPLCDVPAGNIDLGGNVGF